MSVKNQVERWLRESKAYDSLTKSAVYREAILRGDEFVARALGRMQKQSSADLCRHVLVAPTGGGNIGDQALVEAYLGSVNGPVTVLMSGANAVRIPSEHLARVEVRSIKGFMYLPPLLRSVSVCNLASLFRQARTVSVLGADLMDGLYNTAASLSRISSLNMAAKLGKPSVLIGCSWAVGAQRSAVVGLRRAGKAGVKINARDPRSLERMRRDGIVDAQLSADIVFALQGADQLPEVESWIDEASSRGNKLAIVNMSGLIGKRLDQQPEYRLIMRNLLDQDYMIVLLPHVFRSTGNDLDQCLMLVHEFLDDRVRLIERQLSPREVRWLVARADLVVTGRMHLAVMSLSQKTPAITLGSHGKVEGLYEYFPWLPGYVDPSPGFGVAVVQKMRQMTAATSDWESNLVQVNALAARNVEDLV